jgi:hypothetical protein
MELVTLSSRKGLSKKEEREVEFDEESLCPNKEVRPYKFENKPVIFLTSRVHPVVRAERDTELFDWAEESAVETVLASESAYGPIRVQNHTDAQPRRSVPGLL